MRSREEQRFRQAWFWSVLGLAGVRLPLLLRNIRLVVEVDAAGVTLRFRPCRTRRIEARDIRSVEAETYRPPAGARGGWGIRYSARRGWAYPVKGDPGVLLGLVDDRQVRIGSGRAEALAATVAGVRPKGEC